MANIIKAMVCPCILLCATATAFAQDVKVHLDEAGTCITRKAGFLQISHRYNNYTTESAPMQKNCPAGAGVNKR